MTTRIKVDIYYTEFIDNVSKNIHSGQDKETAIKNAVEFAIKENYLDGYFKVQRSEILGMSLTEFDQEEYDRNRREEAREEKALETAQN